MHNIVNFSTFFFFKKIHQFFLSLYSLVTKCVGPFLVALYRYFLDCVNPFWFHLSYFTIVSLIGVLALKMTNTRNPAFSRPDDLDIFFTSVSALTISSMSVIEMEVFSTSQLVVITVLMFVGGEVFVSMLSLILRNIRVRSLKSNQLELGNFHSDNLHKIKYRAIKKLVCVIFGYLIVIHSLGSLLVYLYINLTSSARDTLQKKGLNPSTFSIFLIVSTFANCGYVPTNENMIAFRKNPGLLLIVFPQILLGNTLFPCCLRFVIWVLEKIYKGEEYKYMLNNYGKLGFSPLFSTFNTCMLGATALGFVGLQFVLFCGMEWRNVGLDGLSSYQKAVGSLFQAMNARHSGEVIVDLSTVSTSIILVFVVMMYLPPYTMFIPTWKKDQEKGLIKEDESSTKLQRKNRLLDCMNMILKEDESSTKLQRKSRLLDCMNMILSPLSTLSIFTFLICITERKNLRDDPLNFNLLNIIVEVTSSYGNVGYTMGYSCKRRLNIDERCKDMWFGFSGRWSKEGKVVLIVVMLYGRLKKFYLHGGQGWHLI